MLFIRNPLIFFLEMDKTCVDIFGILLRFLENLQESESCLWCYGQDENLKTAPGIIQLWFNYIGSSFFKALGKHFSREAK